MRDYILMAHTCERAIYLQDMVDFIVQSAQKGLKAQFKGEKVRAKIMSFLRHSRALLQHGVRALTLSLATPAQNFYYEVAESIKKEVEQKYGGTWHCIVGRHFGSFVSYEVKR